MREKSVFPLEIWKTQNNYKNIKTARLKFSGEHQHWMADEWKMSFVAEEWKMNGINSHGTMYFWSETLRQSESIQTVKRGERE